MSSRTSKRVKREIASRTLNLMFMDRMTDFHTTVDHTKFYKTTSIFMYKETKYKIELKNNSNEYNNLDLFIQYGKIYLKRNFVKQPNNTFIMDLNEHQKTEACFQFAKDVIETIARIDQHHDGEILGYCLWWRALMEKEWDDMTFEQKKRLTVEEAYKDRVNYAVCCFVVHRKFRASKDNWTVVGFEFKVPTT